ncbi:MAG: hypothetical protein A2015_06810 [Spirochaetes bacterium GWF1_31_7]|nr:MAG: hypothetical protein A2Y30_09650 [Spirochaetes bacterium GWE1_32_154]OHD46542.1 MAG: hypothetical protein A2015_06810 [Spirochaetes bacterium GWF1_31_7]OHD49351.1 MAG: hypothetical protein A2Y29_03805 [Spirochaetes bacterium GWE2_31_10]HBD93090.1 hydrolase TatD [Spirochaetia bacterium]HBI36793.1 hydrolase TatD [Spirochaetia bacterium]
MSNTLIDTHAHIFSHEYENDLETVIKNSIASGVTKIIIPNINADSILPMIELCDAYPGICFPAIGIHPTDIESSPVEQIKCLEKELLKRKFIAIGETGIDLYWDKSNLSNQIVALSTHIKLASSFDLPLIIHSRNSFQETIDTIVTHKKSNTRGVFHCFSGTYKEACTIIESGFLLGIGGTVTFKNSTLPDILPLIDLKNIVLETDSPYLAPIPYRGKRNEPAYIKDIARKISDIYTISIDEVAKITTENANILFNF